MGTKLKALLAVVGGAVLALGATPLSAHAAPAEQPTITACNGVPVTFYGYTGCAKSNTYALGCDWDNDGDDEIFVIAPNRTIWHIWDTSGGWKQMPNGGLADDTWNCYWNGNGKRQVEVWVSGKGVYYSYYSGGWKGWYKY